MIDGWIYVCRSRGGIDLYIINNNNHKVLSSRLPLSASATVILFTQYNTREPLKIEVTEEGYKEGIREWYGVNVYVGITMAVMLKHRLHF